MTFLSIRNMNALCLFFCLVMAWAQDLDVFNDFNFGALASWRNDCSKKAIQQLLPQCSEGIENLTPIQQKNTALELSICEFENANFVYPIPCKSRETDDCIRELEKSPQYWTTFSGYYREVKNICHQLSLPFEKDQILLVYENITELYKILMNDLHSSNEKSEKAQDALKSKFDKLVDIVDAIIADRNEDKRNLNYSFNQFHENFESSLNNAMIILQNSYNGANTNIQEMESHLNYFSRELHQVHLLMKDRMNQLVLQQDEIQRQNTRILEQTGNTFDGLDRINREVKDIGISTKKISVGIQNQLEYSEFSISLLNSHLEQSINDIMLQRQYIGIQGPIVLGEISKAFVEQLNITTLHIIGTLGNLVNSTLLKINLKIKQTEKSIDDMNFKALQFANSIELLSLWFSKIVTIPNGIKNFGERILQKTNSVGQMVTLGLFIITIVVALPFINIFTKFLLKPCMKLATDIGIFIGPISLGILSAFAILLTLSHKSSESTSE